MRWGLVKRAWALAKQQYPKVARLYVDIPAKFGAVGECHILDLDNPSKPLGVISYDMRSVGDQPKMVFSSGGPSVAVGMPRQASFQSPIKTSVKGCAGTIRAVAGRYAAAELPKQLAIVAVGHRDGIAEAAAGTSRAAVSQWLRQNGLNAGLSDDVCKAIANMGIPVGDGPFNMRTAKPTGNTFEKLQRVRVKDPMSMEFQECGQVLAVKGSRRDGYWYSVLVDGSESPKWFPQENLDSLHAGWIAPEAKEKGPQNAV